MPMSRSMVAVVFGMVLFHSGCVTTGPLAWVNNGFKVGPSYCRPSAPVAEDWIEGQNPALQSRQPQYADWWKLFQDPTLTSLIDTAYEQNLTLRVVGARVIQAPAQQAIAAGNFWPQTQQATGQFSQVNLSANSANSPAVITSFLPSPLPPGLPPFGTFYPDWTTGFNMSWELDFWGRIRRNIESNNARLDASVDNLDDALVTLVADVATNYVQYRVAQQRIKIARDNVRIQEGLVALARDRFKAGTGNKIDEKQAQTILEQTRSSIPALEIVLGQASDTLCTLLGKPPQDLERELGPGPELGANPVPNTPDWLAAGIPADLLRRRPERPQCRAPGRGPVRQIGVAEAELYPTIYINGTIGYEAADLSKLFESRSFMGTITPNFKWNILNYGRILNNVRQQQAHTQELVASYQNQVLTASREVQIALRGFLRSKEQAEDLARGVQAASEATKLGMDQYRVGIIPFNTVFTLTIAQIQQQDSLAVAQGNIALNLINAYRALGGGWEIRCRDSQFHRGRQVDQP